MGWRASSIASCRAHYPQASQGFPELSSAVALGFAIGWQAFIRRGRKCIYPNLVGILLGESSITMKSSVINFYREILVHSSKDFGLNNPASTEAFENSLSSTNDTIWWLNPELGVLLSTMTKDYGRGIADTLTLLIDSEEIHRQYASKKPSIHVDPKLLFGLWGVTPAVIMDYLEPVHAEQGFLQRPAVVYGIPGPFVQMPKVTPQMTMDFECVRDDFHNFFLLVRNSSITEITLHQDAETLLGHWEQDLDTRVRTGLLGAAGAKRAVEIALRLCIINKFDDLHTPPANPEVSLAEMDVAIKEAETYMNGANALRDLLSDEKGFAKVKDFIRTRGPADESRIMNSCNISAKQWSDIEKSLLKRKLVQKRNGVYQWL